MADILVSKAADISVDTSPAVFVLLVQFIPSPHSN